MVTLPSALAMNADTALSISLNASEIPIATATLFDENEAASEGAAARLPIAACSSAFKLTLAAVIPPAPSPWMLAVTRLDIRFSA